MKTIGKTIVLIIALVMIGVLPCAAGIAPDILNLPDGYQAGLGFDVNAGGQVAGFVGGESGQAVCVWTNGVPVVLPDLGNLGELGDYYSRQVNGINDSGVVVGYCQNDTNHWRATRWAPDADDAYTAEDLGVLEGEDESNALAINADGQILCDNGYGRGWFLWEEGVRTEITTDDGTPLDARAKTGFLSGGLLASNGRVAGTALLDLGVQDEYGNELYAEEAFLWQKTADGITVIQLTFPGDSRADGRVDAISRDGIVAGWSSADGYFLYDSNTATFSYVETAPPAEGSVIYSPWGVWSVNDQGQALFGVVAYDTATDEQIFQLWIWQAGTWTQVPTDGLIPAGSTIQMALAAINDSGQVAGTLMISDLVSGMNYVAFGWSAAMGTQKLLAPPGTDMSLAVGLNDSGLAVGGAGFMDSSLVLPVTWDLTAPVSALDISHVTVTSPSAKSPNITVTVQISNPSDTTVYDVIVTSASLGGVDTKSTLPLVYGAMKPGASKKCTLTFRGVPPGNQTITIRGTSSLGDFFTTETVSMP